MLAHILLLHANIVWIDKKSADYLFIIFRKVQIMNIQVFFVNRGDMLLFDLSLAMEKVSKLQEIIEVELDIPVDNQVLLMSGGEMVSSDERVCSYTSGKDSCPMFLFNLKAIEEKNPPEIVTESLDRENIRLRIEGSMNMAPTLVTLSTRTQLALELKELSVKHEKLCKELVHHQHLQHQGWCTVVANFEDSLAAFIDQADRFVPWYQRLLDRKPQQMEMLESFPNSCKLLSKMPILSSLTDHFTGGQSSETLLKYCTTLDDTQDILAEVDSSRTELIQMDIEHLNEIVSEKEKVLEAANQYGMKEVKGLEKRLYGLEQLIVNAGKLVNTQVEYAKSFVSNQRRCRELADPHILHDLSVSHKEQLRLMESEDQLLRHIVVKCEETKRELCANLHARLRWIMYVQKMVSSLHHRIYMQYSSCSNLKLRLERLEQICRAPTVYSQLCVEVCRRRNFASAYKSWSQEVYDKSTELHQKELQSRKELLLSIGTHFLREFFPGLDRIPPAIMSCPASELDEDLAAVSEGEITSLRQTLPELTQWLRLPDAIDSKLSSIQFSPSSQQSHIQPPSCSPSCPDTPSDIAVLTPKTNQSSQSSVNTAFSPTVSSSSLTLKHTAASSSSVVDFASVVPLHTEFHIDTTESVPLQLTHTLDASDQSEHMMARCEQLSGDELSEEERAPTSLSLNDDNSGGFMTANFFFNEGQQSLSTATDMANTITMQNSEIEKLMSENASHKQKYTSYRQKYNHLKELFHNIGKSFQEQLQCLRETNQSTQKDVSAYSTYLEAFQTQILNTVQTVSTLQQQEMNKQVMMCQSTNDLQISQLTQKLNEQELENCELLKVIKRLEKDKEILLAQIDDVADGKAMEIESIVQKAEQSLIKQLTLQHELELDQASSNVTLDLEVKEQELADKDVKIEKLRLQIDNLSGQIENESTMVELRIGNLNLEFAQTLEEKVAELNCSHDKDKKALSKEFQCKMQEELHRALNTQKTELGSTYMQQLQKMVKPTADISVNTDDGYLYEDLLKVQQEYDFDKQQALVKQAEQMQADFGEELETLRHNFMEQIKQQKESHEQEFENRALTMRDSFQLANEMRLEEKLTVVRKEKDSVIAELRRHLSDISNTVKHNAATATTPAATATTPAATVTAPADTATAPPDTATTPAATVTTPAATVTTPAATVTTASHATTVSTITPDVGAMAESVIPVPMETSVANDKQRLTEQLHIKENLIKKLQFKINDFEMSASSQGMIQADKVTVKSCAPGDKVILCYDPKHDHYVVFSLATTLHFLHSDCLKDLNLETTSSDQRKTWVLAEILDKEYCMARKPTNRFKVPVNTKFYRVRAKPWSI